MSRSTRAFSTTKIKLSEFPEDVRETIEMMFMSSEAAKADAVGAQRQAIMAVNEALSKRAAAQTAEVKILAAAAHHHKAIECEPRWIIYRNSQSEIIFEGLTDRVIRNTSRAALHKLGRQAEEMGTSLDMYEDDSDDEDKDRGHGE